MIIVVKRIAAVFDIAAVVEVDFGVFAVVSNNEVVEMNRKIVMKMTRMLLDEDDLMMMMMIE